MTTPLRRTERTYGYTPLAPSAPHPHNKGAVRAKSPGRLRCIWTRSDFIWVGARNDGEKGGAEVGTPWNGVLY